MTSALVDKQLLQQLEARCYIQQKKLFFSTFSAKAAALRRLTSAAITLTLEQMKSCRVSFCSSSLKHPFIQPALTETSAARFTKPTFKSRTSNLNSGLPNSDVSEFSVSEHESELVS